MIKEINYKESDLREFRREKHFEESYVALDKRGEEIIDLRIYQTRAITSAAVWVRRGDLSGRGGAKASGYGYNRASQAAINALALAGVEFTADPGGSDLATITETVARFVAGDDFLCVVHAHG